jgi:hypothetical protein
VLDDVSVDDAWAVIYPPSYQPPEPPEGEDGEPQIVDENLHTITLLSQADNWRGAQYSNFREPGMYRVVVYADDDEGEEAYARTLEVWVGHKLYLPLVIK